MRVNIADKMLVRHWGYDQHLGVIRVVFQGPSSKSNKIKLDRACCFVVAYSFVRENTYRI